MAYSDNTEYSQGQQVYINIPQGDFTKQRIIIGKYFPNDDNKFIYNYVSPMNSFVSITGNIISEIENGSTWLIANGKTKYKCIWEGRVSLTGYDTLGISAGFRSWLNNYNDLVGGEYGIQVDIRSEQATSQQQKMPLFYTFYFSNREMTGDPYNYDTFYPQEKIFDISGIKQIDAIRIGFYQNANFKSKSQGYLISAAEEIEQNANLFINNPIVAVGYNSNNFKEDQIILRSPSNEMYLTKLTDTIKTKYPDVINYTEDEIQEFIKELNQKEINALWVHLLTEQEQTGIYNLTASGISATRTISIADLNDYDEPFNLFWYRYIFDENQKYEGVTWDPIAGEYWAELTNNRNNFSITVDPDVKKVEERYKAVIEYPAKEDVLSAIEEYLNQKDGLYAQRNSLIEKTDIKIKDNNNEDLLYIPSYNDGNIEDINIIERQKENSLYLVNMQLNFLEIQHNYQVSFINQNEFLNDEEKDILLQEENEKYNIEYTNLMNKKDAVNNSSLNLITNKEIYNYFLNLLNLDTDNLLKEISTVINNLKASITDDQQFNTEASNYIDNLEFKNQLRILQLYFPKYIEQYNNILIPGYSPQYMTQIMRFFSDFRINFNNDKIETNTCFTEEDVNEKNALLFICNIISQINDIDYEIDSYRNAQLGTIQYYSSNPIIFKNTDPTAHLNAMKEALSNLEIVVDEDGFKGTYNLYEGDGHIQNEGEASELRVLEAKYEKYSPNSDPTENNEIITWRIPLYSTMIQPPEEGVEYELYEEVEKSTYNDDGTFIAEKEVTKDNYKNSLYYYYDSDNEKYVQIISSSTIKKPDPNNTENLIDVEDFYNDIEQFYKRNNINAYEENGYMIISRRGDPIQHFRIKPFCEASFTNNEIFCTVEKDLINLEASATLSFSPVGNNGTDYTFYLEFYDNQNQFALQAMGFSEDDISKDKHKLKVRARVFNEMHQEITNQINHFTWKLLGGSSDKKVTIDDDVQTSQNVIYSTIANQEDDFRLDANNNPILDENNIPIDHFSDDFKNLIIKCQCSSDIALGGDIDTLTDIDEDGNIISIPLDANKTNITLTAYLLVPVIRRKGIIGGYIGSGLISYDNSGANPFYYNGNFKVYDINFQNLNYEETNVENNIIKDNYWSILGLDPGEERYFPQITYEGSLSVPSIYLYEDKQISISFTHNNNIEFILPLRLYKRVYASKVINSWDGSLTLNENDGIILSTMMGAGYKSPENKFNGVVMGDMNPIEEETEGNIFYTGAGIYGFNEGEKSFGFNIHGNGFIGRASGAQILFNGNEGQLSCASYAAADGWENVTEDSGQAGGILIDLDDSYIDFLGEKESYIDDNNNKFYGRPHIKIDANPGSESFFKITNSQKKNLIYIGGQIDSSYYLKSANYNGTLLEDGSISSDGTEGCFLDLKNGSFVANNAKLSGKLVTRSEMPNFELIFNYHKEATVVGYQAHTSKPSILAAIANEEVGADNWAFNINSSASSDIKYRDPNGLHKAEIILENDSIKIKSSYETSFINNPTYEGIFNINRTYKIQPYIYSAERRGSQAYNGTYIKGYTTETYFSEYLEFSGGPIRIANSLYVNNLLVAEKGANIYGDLTTTGNLIGKNGIIHGDLAVDNNIMIQNQLIVDMEARFHDYVYMYYLKESSTMQNTSHYLYVTADGLVKIHTSSSSKKYKENIKILNNADIDKLYNIPVYTFNYKKGFLSEDDERKDKNMPGFIVEDWDAIMPIAVDHNKTKKGEDRNMWNSNIVIPLMFQMIKNDHEKIESLEQKITQLEKLINEKFN